MVAGAIVPSRPSRHFFNSVAASKATGFDNSALVRCTLGCWALYGLALRAIKSAFVLLQRAVDGDRCAVGASVPAARELLGCVLR